MKLDELTRTVQSIAASTRGFLPFIDALNNADINTVPKLSKAGRVTSLRFRSADSGESITAGQAGLIRMMQGGPIYFSQTFHAPVLQALEELHMLGAEQPKVLDEAGEVVLAHGKEPGEDAHSGGLGIAIMRAREDPAACPSLFPILDFWSPMGRDELVECVNLMGYEGVPMTEIEAMPEVFGNAALRWTLRGLPAQTALAHTQTLMGDAAVEPDEYPRP